MRVQSMGKGMLAAVMLVWCATAWCRGVSPYLPLNLSPVMERRIDAVLVLADRPVLRRPIAAAQLLDALPVLCRKYQMLCEQVKEYLAPYMQEVALTQADVDLAASSGADVALPNRHGMSNSDTAEVSATALWQPADHLLVSGGVVAHQQEIVPTGTMLSAGFAGAQLDIGYRDHWWSPMTDSAMLDSTEAPTMPSITLSSYEPLTALGIEYETFLARMSYSDHIQSETGALSTAGNPRLFGVHVDMRPFPGWSAGFNRQEQFGGGDRNSAFGNLLKAFFKPGKYDNAQASGPPEEGNQEASYVGSFIFPGKHAFETYFEYSAEDTSKFKSYLLGNAGLSAGIHVPALVLGLDFTYEVSEWQNGWWVHHIYMDGMRNRGYVVGNWGGDWRQLNDGVGAATQMLQVSYGRGMDDYLLRYRTIRNQSYSGVDYQPGYDVTVGYTRRISRVLVGTELEFGRTVMGDRYRRLSGSLRFSPSALFNISNDDSSDDAGEGEFFIHSGGVSYNQIYDPNELMETHKSRRIKGVDLGLGARRPVSDWSDVGVRLDYANLGGGAIVGARVLDYRYRLGRSLAFTGFLGAAREALGTPAFGWYMGAGAQWRNIIPHVDLQIEYRLLPSMQRDRLLPDEAGIDPDVFYQLAGYAIGLSCTF